MVMPCISFTMEATDGAEASKAARADAVLELIVIVLS
jgi:hypothetical protein